MKRTFMVVFVVFGLIMFPITAFAASPWTEKTTYGEKTMGKLEFGVRNTLLGWTDLIVETNKAQNAWAGLGKGLVDGVVNTLGGVLHLVTFPIPFVAPRPED